MTTVQFLSPPRAVSMSDGWFELATVDHFWMEWRFEALRLLADHLPGPAYPMLEVGCGHGVFRQQLEEQLGYTVDGCDLNIAALEKAGAGRGKLFVYDIHDCNPSLVGKYSAVFLMDVIEHIQDDAAFLDSAARHVKAGGIVVVGVPAAQWLHSRYDDEVGHVRRYNRDRLTALLLSVGLKPLAVRYWGFSLIPVLVGRKLMLAARGSGSVVKPGFQPPSGAIHACLKWLKTAETKVLRAPVCGTSLLAIAQVANRH